MRKHLLPVVLAVLVPVALIAGLWLGGHPSNLPGFIRDAFVGDSDAQAYQDVLDRIHDDYYRKVNAQDLNDKGLKAVVASLGDPFSRYIDPKEYSDFQADTSGNFGGVGMDVKEVPRGLQILDVFPGGPAQKAGLKRGDLITAVNGKSLKGRPSTDSTTQIKGPAGTKVKLTYVSGGITTTKTLTRAKVTVPVSQKRLITHDGTKIGYVSLSQFTAGAHGAVLGNIHDLMRQGAKGIVLDLRNNGGGLLEEGVLTASIFIPNGLIVSTHGRERPTKRYNATGDAISSKIPVAVLVNENTASASEIVTGALQDRGRATVVGTTTYGKGVFQEIEDLQNGGALDITVGEYFTPKGRNLGPHDGHRGLTPDVTIADNPKTKPDEALDKAVAVVAGKL